MDTDKLMEKALGFLEYITSASWNSVFKFVVVSSLIFIGVEIRQNNNFIKEFWQEKQVHISTESKGKVDDAVAELLRDIPEIQAVAVYIYQPETFPKKSSELLLSKVRKGYTNYDLHRELHNNAVLHINVPLYRDLARNDYISLPSPKYEDLTRELEYDAQATSANIYGLYHFGAVAGSVVVIFKAPRGRHTIQDSHLKQIYLGVRYINSIIYER